MSTSRRDHLQGEGRYDGSRPLTEEESPARRRIFVVSAAAIALIGVGVLLGIWVAPESPTADKERLSALERDLAASQEKVTELERTLLYRAVDAPALAGKLAPADRERHERKGREYANVLRQAQAQAAAELMEWFVTRWNQLLDQPQENDRVTRRAATLSLLVGGMAETLNPEDYVPWQAEFFNSKWLGELAFDLDHDGLPGSRGAPNTRDGFADVSVCHIAMALNQAVNDAQILVMPDMRCDRPAARMSLFLPGKTFNDALNEFVRAVRREGFLVTERSQKGIRLILVGSGSRMRRVP